MEMEIEEYKVPKVHTKKEEDEEDNEEVELKKIEIM